MIEDIIAAAVQIPKKYLFPYESTINIKKERDEFLNWLKEFDKMANEENYLEATLWLKNKMKEYYIKEAKRELNEC